MCSLPRGTSRETFSLRRGLRRFGYNICRILYKVAAFFHLMGK